MNQQRQTRWKRILCSILGHLLKGSAHSALNTMVAVPPEMLLMEQQSADAVTETAPADCSLSRAERRKWAAMVKRFDQTDARELPDRRS